MKALRFDSTGSLDALYLAEVPRPEAGPGEVVVRVDAAGVNPSDYKNVLGKFAYTTVPRTVGRDFAGTVVAGPDELVGTQVWGSGKELGFTRDGSNAEYLALPTAGVAMKPANLSFAEAAACGVPYLTAWEALQRSEVREGTSVVIIGMGAVGTAAHALAVAAGARALVAVRRSEQADALRARGIAAVALDEQLAARVREPFSGGAEVVFDTTGFWLPDAVAALAPGGRVAVIAAPADGHERVPVLDFYRRGGSLYGVNSLLHDTVASAVSLSKVRPLFESGALPVPTGIVTRPLDKAVETYRDLEAGANDKFVFVP